MRTTACRTILKFPCCVQEPVKLDDEQTVLVNVVSHRAGLFLLLCPVSNILHAKKITNYYYLSILVLLGNAIDCTACTVALTAGWVVEGAILHPFWHMAKCWVQNSKKFQHKKMTIKMVRIS